MATIDDDMPINRVEEVVDEPQSLPHRVIKTYPYLEPEKRPKDISAAIAKVRKFQRKFGISNCCGFANHCLGEILHKKYRTVALVLGLRKMQQLNAPHIFLTLNIDGTDYMLDASFSDADENNAEFENMLKVCTFTDFDPTVNLFLGAEYDREVMNQLKYWILDPQKMLESLPRNFKRAYKKIIE